MFVLIQTHKQIGLNIFFFSLLSVILDQGVFRTVICLAVGLWKFLRFRSEAYKTQEFVDQIIDEVRHQSNQNKIIGIISPIKFRSPIKRKTGADSQLNEKEFGGKNLASCCQKSASPNKSPQKLEIRVAANESELIPIGNDTSGIANIQNTSQCQNDLLM